MEENLMGLAAKLRYSLSGIFFFLQVMQYLVYFNMRARNYHYATSVIFYKAKYKSTIDINPCRLT